MNALHDTSSILIVLLGSVGDVARGLALVHQIKTQRPRVRITWLVEPKSYDVVVMNRGIDEILVFDRPRGVHGFLRAVRELRSRSFDVVLDLQRHFKSGLFSWLSSAPLRIGFHRLDSKEGNWLFNTTTIAHQGESIPKLDHYLTFLEPLGLSVTKPLDFGIREQALAEPISSDLNVAESIIGLVLGSAWPSKDWPAQGYQKLIQLLLAGGSKQLVLLGDKKAQELGEKLAATYRGDKVVSVAGKTTLRQAIALLARASQVVGPDSGPGHICGALGVPYVALFGPTDPARTAPYGSEHLVIQSAVGCSPCYRRTCPGLDRVCMRLISPERVVEKIDRN